MELDDSKISNFTMNSSQLNIMVESVKAIQKKVKPKNYQDIETKMSNLSQNVPFLQFMSDLSKVSEFRIHFLNVYDIKLNGNRSDKDNALLLEMI
jgi:hypothetical protein